MRLLARVSFEPTNQQTTWIASVLPAHAWHLLVSLMGSPKAFARVCLNFEIWLGTDNPTIQKHSPKWPGIQAFIPVESGCLVW